MVFLMAWPRWCLRSSTVAELEQLGQQPADADIDVYSASPGDCFDRAQNQTKLPPDARHP
jgi:hypothetical protein